MVRPASLPPSHPLPPTSPSSLSRYALRPFGGSRTDREILQSPSGRQRHRSKTPLSKSLLMLSSPSDLRRSLSSKEVWLGPHPTPSLFSSMSASDQDESMIIQTPYTSCSSGDGPCRAVRVIADVRRPCCALSGVQKRVRHPTRLMAAGGELLSDLK